MSFHHILSNLVSNFGKGPKRGFKKNLFLNLFSELVKSLQPTLESSSIQTTEPIVKCHTILEMGSHALSLHTFGSPIFERAPKGGFKKTIFGLIFCQGRVQLDAIKIFAGLSKHMYVFLLGTENVMGGRWR